LHVRIAERHLPRRSAIHRQHENLCRAVLQIACAIEAEGQRIDHLDAFVPFRAFRRRWRLCEAWRLALHEHAERHMPAVRRPGRFRRAFQELGQRKTAPAVHVEDAYFRLAVRLRGKDHPAAIWRPARGRGAGPAGHQWPVAAVGKIQDPYPARILVGHAVHGMAHIGDRFAVGRDLRVRRVFHVEYPVGREPLGRGLILFRQSRACCEQCAGTCHQDMPECHCFPLLVFRVRQTYQQALPRTTEMRGMPCPALRPPLPSIGICPPFQIPSWTASMPGRGGMFSRDNGRGQRFLSRARAFSPEECAILGDT